MNEAARLSYSEQQIVDQAAQSLAGRFSGTPKVAMILGSGLGTIVDAMSDAVTVSYREIPGWQTTTISGHRGALVFGRLADVEMILMVGRLHRYEGWAVDQVCFPVRVLAALGVQSLIVSNAAGGVHPNYRVGDIVVIEDHIDLMHGHPQLRNTLDPGDFNPPSDQPLRGGNPYDTQLNQLALRSAIRHDFAAHQGTYLATLGPNYETRAEYRMMRRLGADVVGMSTVPEVLQAHRLGMRILGMSMVSNIARPDAPVSASHEEVLDAGKIAAPKMKAIVVDVVGKCPQLPAGA